MRLLTLFFVLLIVELSCTSKQNENGSNQLESDTITINDNSVAAHNCNLIKRTDTVNSTMIVLSIEKEEFKRLANLHLRKVDQLKYLDSDSLETIYQRSFPKIFSLEDSSYSFKSWQGDDIKVRKNISNDKDYEDYKFVNVKCGKVVIYTSAYESWGFLVVDPETGVSSATLGIPNFIDCSVYYSTSNYYGEEEISIVDMKNKKAATLLFNGWGTEQAFNVNYDLLYKLSNRQCKDTLKYLELSMR
jgi:hypothetical protein